MGIGPSVMARTKKDTARKAGVTLPPASKRQKVNDDDATNGDEDDVSNHKDQVKAKTEIAMAESEYSMNMSLMRINKGYLSKVEEQELDAFLTIAQELKKCGKDKGTKLSQCMEKLLQGGMENNLENQEVTNSKSGEKGNQKKSASYKANMKKMIEGGFDKEVKTELGRLRDCSSFLLNICMAEKLQVFDLKCGDYLALMMRCKFKFLRTIACCVILKYLFILCL
jgi:hypothetical protein